MNESMRKALLILGELNNDDLNWMLQKGKKEIISPGHTLIYEGRPINAFYIVLRGTLRVVLDEKELAKIGKGEVVGEISFIDSRTPVATVKALDEVVVLSVPQLQLTMKIQREEGFAARFYHGILLCLADRMRGTVNRLGKGTALEEVYYGETEEHLPISPEHLQIAQAKFNWLMSYVGEK